MTRDSGSDRQAKTPQAVEGEASQSGGASRIAQPVEPSPTAEVELLRAYAREASIALMKLSGGGSEMFKRIGQEYYAEPDLCVTRAEHRIDTIQRIYKRKAELRRTPQQTEAVEALREWRRIETAPKDGSAIRLYDPECDEDADGFGSSWDGHWTDTTGPGEGVWQAGVWCNYHDCFETREINPTHWMPHPAPPALSPIKGDSNG